MFGGKVRIGVVWIHVERLRPSLKSILLKPQEKHFFANQGKGLKSTNAGTTL